MTNTLVYLDHNATSPVKPGVAEAMSDALTVCGNPSSVHGAGRRARALVDQAREQVAELVGADGATVIFTSGGTEANNMALRGMARGGRRIIASAVEHPSVAEPAKALGAEIILVDENGVADLEALSRLLTGGDRPALVSLMLANNETGVLQPLAEAAELAHAHGALVHCDGVQGPGRTAVDILGLGVDLLTLSAHKMAGPMGVGALVVGPAAHGLKAQAEGGGQEKGLRPGTENVSGVVGFGAAAALAGDDLNKMPALAALRDRIQFDLTSVAPEAEVFGGGAPRLGNTLLIAMPGVESDTQLMDLDLAGVAVSAGSACSSGKVKASPVLQAMGVGDEAAGRALRISLGWNSTAEDVDKLVAAWKALYLRLNGEGRSATQEAVSLVSA